MRVVLAAACAVLILLAWCLVGWPQNPPGGSAAKFSSLSFESFRPWESPLADRFPTEAEVDADMALVSAQTAAIRTYAAIEGSYDTARLAQKHGLKLWQGIWLGADRAKNEIEINRGIEAAHAYPETVTRVVVGNEVLLRRDLPPAELIAYIDRVRHAIKQPVAYADVWEFWLQFPEVAPHVDILLVHLLPYWEDVPTGIDRAVAHVGDVFTRMQQVFPGKTIAIGETGWPSRGRERADAVPSLVNQTIFLRRFLALSRARHFDYNFFETFDEAWKYRSEGTIGANWGIFDSARHIKIPRDGSISNDPAWRWHAACSIAAGLLLCLLGLRAPAPLSPRRTYLVIMAAMALGSACVFAAETAWQTLFDIHLALAAAVNIPAQAALAALAVLRLSGQLGSAPRSGVETTEAVRAALTLRSWPRWGHAFRDISFLFVWAAAVMQMLLLCDGRYREFPLSSFAVPILVTAGRVLAGDLPRTGGGREEFFVGVTLVLAAVGSAILEGALNRQSLAWNGCAVLLAVPCLLSLHGAARDGVAMVRSQRGLPP